MRVHLACRCHFTRAVSLGLLWRSKDMAILEGRLASLANMSSLAPACAGGQAVCRAADRPEKVNTEKPMEVMWYGLLPLYEACLEPEAPLCLHYSACSICSLDTFIRCIGCAENTRIDDRSSLGRQQTHERVQSVHAGGGQDQAA